MGNLKCDDIKRLITLTSLSCSCSSIVVLKCEALRNKFCFGKALSIRPTSTIRETRKRQLNSLYFEFNNYFRYITSFNRHFRQKKLVIFVKELIFDKTRYT
jgi:hypothetical protein